MTKNAEKLKQIPSAESHHTINLPNYDAKIAELAYYKAANRNFEPGREMDDWLEAEQEYMQGEM
ncbi:MAG: DUF2934 domain-containing protein [Methylomonas sp.]|jgi:hypothetical protein